jgi:predicted aspartyl protease
MPLDRLGDGRLGGSVSLSVRGAGLTPILTVPAIIDTGFTDELVLASETIDELGIDSSGDTMVTLGDGSVVFMSVVELEIEWNGSWLRVKAYAGETDALVGFPC